MTECLLCNSSSDLLFKAKVLNEYVVSYFKCSNCGFIQTEKPYWLDKAYSEAISSLDVGIVHRNLNLARITEKVIFKCFNPTAKFLDYGGGYGLFVRLMRDRGFDFYRQDAYCKNMFSKHFDLEDINTSEKFELLTAFEVFEHLYNPLIEIEKMFNYSDLILFSTQLQPVSSSISNVHDWWYFVPESGQHLSFFTIDSLNVICDHFDCSLYSNGSNIHLLTKREISLQDGDLIKMTTNDNINWLSGLKKKALKAYSKNYKNQESLISSDFEHIRKLYNK